MEATQSETQLPAATLTNSEHAADTWARLLDKIDNLREAVSANFHQDLPGAAAGFAYELERAAGQLGNFLDGEFSKWCQRNAFCSARVGGGICGHPRYRFISGEPRCVDCYDKARELAAGFRE